MQRKQQRMQLPEKASELKNRIDRLEESERKLRDELNALREIERRFQLITDNIQEVFWIRDLEKNKTIYVSPAFEKVFGLTSDSLYEDSDSYMNILHRDDLDILDRANEQRRNGLYTDIQYRIIRPDGQVRWIRSRTFPIFNEDRQAHQTVGIAQDITDRKKAEESLRQSEERYRTVLDEMDEGYQEVDLAGNFTFFNDAFLRIFGYSAEEMTGKNYSLFAADEKFAKKVYRAYNKMFRTGVPLKRFDWDIIRKDGARRTIEFYASLLRDSQDRPTGFRGIVRDITDSKITVDALKESEEKYRTILESTEEGYFEVDMAGNFTFFNPSLSIILGYPEDEMMGMNNRVYMENETARKVYRAFNETYRTGVIRKYIDWELIRKDGSRVNVETSISLKRNASGKPIGFRGLVRDITERKRAEESLKKAFRDLQEAKDMLVQSEKLAAMGRLSSGVAHEIRNPLNIMSLNLQMLEIKGKLNDETKKAVDICHAQIARIVKIIEGLRKFSRVSEKKLTPESIREVIDHVLSLSAPRLRTEDVAVSVNCDPDLPALFMDRPAMEQVLFNLVSNALDAMRDGGKRKLGISCGKKDGSILVTVSDTGHGIREEHMPKLFDPFFTTKDPDKGTGLGLSISYGIIQDHMGKIWAVNNVGGGASLFIELPIIQ